MKVGSLFDGSGGFPLVANMCGITPAWASEVEPYPIAVTKSRFPNMKHLGDVSKINGAKIEPVDIITFGSPCQDLSIAGKQAGLKHKNNGDEETTRSGLFIEAIRIIKERRGATDGKYPTFALWENVPGAFSSNKGEDFRVVLEEIIKIKEPTAEMPPMPKDGWPYADCYMGDGWSIAYRVLDAQYWGVSQRRRRIYLVADFRSERAGKILFEHEGLRGYFKTSRTPWKGTSADSERSVDSDDRERENDCLTFEPGIASREGGHIYEGVAGTLRAEPGDNRMAVVQKTILDDQRGKQITIRSDDKSPIMIEKSEPIIYDGSGITSPINASNPHPGDPCHTLGTDSRNYVVYCLQGNGIDRADTAGCNGKGVKEDICYTLNTIDRPAVAYAMQAFGKYQESEKASALKARDYKDATDLICGIDCRNLNEYRELYPTLQAKLNGGQSLNFSGAVRYIVRRLTPTECARLQGFPDKWGHPDRKDNFTDEEYRFWVGVRNTHAEINGRQVREYTKDQMITWYNKLYTDNAEYKMWGNGIALPCALYVMQGIMAEDSENEKVIQKNM